jgi:hypothetical protein
MIGFLSLLAFSAKNHALDAVASGKRRTLEWLLDLPSDQRQAIARTLVSDVHMGAVRFGEHSVTIADLITMDTQAPTALGEIGMNATSGRPQAYIGGAARDLLGGHEIIQPDGAVACTSDQPMGSNKITGLATPTATGDAATKGYVDGVATGLQWVAPADTDGYIGNLAALAIEALTPANGDTYVVSTANGAGDLSTAVLGDVWQYVTGAWVKIATGSGGFVAADVRLTVYTGGTALVSPLTDGVDEGKYADFDGTSLTPTLSSPADGDAILMKGDGGQNENKAYVFDGAVPTGSWIQFAGSGGDHGSQSGLGDDDHTQYALLAGRAGGQSLAGGTVSGNNLILDSNTSQDGETQIDASLFIDGNTGFVGVGGSPSVMFHLGNLLTGQEMRIGGATCGSVLPATDDTGNIGSASKRFNLVRATSVTSGDHNFVHTERGVALTVTEFEDGLCLVNRKTGKWFKLSMEPCEPRCDDSELAPIGDELDAIDALAAK